MSEEAIEVTACPMCGGVAQAIDVDDPHGGPGVRYRTVPCAPTSDESAGDGEWCNLLVRYGQHHPDCYWLDDDDHSAGCNCGWAQKIERYGLNCDPESPPPPLAARRLEGGGRGDDVREAAMASLKWFHRYGYGRHGPKIDGKSVVALLEDALYRRPTDTEETR